VAIPQVLAMTGTVILKGTREPETSAGGEGSKKIRRGDKK